MSETPVWHSAEAGVGMGHNVWAKFDCAGPRRENGMKHIIAKLLQDFESGFMNRRQLIESLALAAGAAAAMTGSAEAQASGAAAMPKGSPFKTVELDHISYQVNDYRVTRDFYA